MYIVAGVTRIEIYIQQRRAVAKALTGREERKVKSEKKWVLRTELIINHTVGTTLAVVRFFKTVYYVLTQPVYYLIKLCRLLLPLNNKSTVTNNYIFILYRRGELCSPVFNLL